jgi:hypothetical protein
MGSPFIPYNTDDESHKSTPPTTDKPSPPSETDKPIDSGGIIYMGGHKAYPKPTWGEIYFYEDRFEIKPYDICIQYSKIKDIGNSNEKKRDASRLAAGLIFLPLALSYLWKKDHIYTIIEYDDEVDTQKVVIDFGKGLNYAQNLIYKKMLEARKSK